MELLHPIRLMARQDGDLTTVLHSFFLYTYDNQSSSAEVLCRHPKSRKNIEMVEEGLKGLLTETLIYSEDNEISVANVLSNHDGRLYMYASGTRNRIIAVVTALPTISFCRSLLEQFQLEPTESLLATVYTLCELPILPMPKMKYNFNFLNSSASIKFTELEQVEEIDMDVIVLNCFTPIMLVKAWEALVTERRIVVTSSNPALLLPSCEFLKKIITPFSFVGTYIPFIPSSGIEALEAPGNFIIGVDTNALKTAQVSLNGIVILDLDRRTIIHTPTTPDDPYYRAPPCLISYLHRTITQIMDDPFVKWINRPYTSLNSHIECPYSVESWINRSSNIVRAFAKTNLSILSAQYCTAKAFFRQANKYENEDFLHSIGFNYKKDPITLMGYSEHRSVHVGCMQLWKDPGIIEDAMHHTIPCWVEMDNCAFALYEQADDLPLILIPIEEIEAVASSSMEPEGHVFEVTLKNQNLYRFTTSDSNCRKQWLHAIERKMTETSKGYQIISIATASQIRVKPQYLNHNTILPQSSSPYAPNNNNNNAQQMSNAATNVEEIETPFLASELGVPSFTADFSESSEVEHYHDFRHLIRKTQFSLMLYSQTECERFETLFTKRAETLYSFIYDNHSYDNRMKKYLSTIPRTADTLRTISLDYEEEKKAGKSANQNVNNYSYDTNNVNMQFNASFAGKLSVSSQLRSSGDVTDSMTTSIDAGSMISPNDDNNKKKGLIQRLFSTSSKSAKPSNAVKVPTDEEQQQALADAERELYERNYQVALERLAVLSAIYNRCLSAINTNVVEDRIRTMEKFLGDHVPNSTLSSVTLLNSSSSNLMMVSEHEVTYRLGEIISPLLSVATSSALGGLQSESNSPVPNTNSLRRKITPIRLASGNNANVSLDNVQISYDLFERLYESFLDAALVSSTAAVSRRSSNAFNAIGTEKSAPSTPVRVTSLQRQQLPFEDSSSGNIAVAPLNINPDESSSVTPSNTQNEGDLTVSVGEEENENEDADFDISVLQINQIDDSLYEKLHEDVKARIIAHLQEQVKQVGEESPIAPVLETLLGYTLQNTEDYTAALQLYSRSNLVNQRRIAYCILQQFMRLATSTLASVTDGSVTVEEKDCFDELSFISQAYGVKNIIGMHAYRLILELVYTELQSRYMGGNKYSVPPVVLGSFRSFPRSGVNNIVASRAGNNNNGIGGRKKTVTRSGGTEFEWIESDNNRSSEIINEMYICTKLNIDISPCELSAQLLNKLREVLKLYAKSPAGEKYCIRNAGEFPRLRLTPQMLNEIQQLSSFKKFELETCQLQKIDMNLLTTTNEKLLLFTNIYNMLVVHSSIIRGSPGHSILERTSFMRSSKYNIGGYIFSLIDIEHGVLRNASTKPMLLGPLSIDMSFSERDPRYKFALDRPKPNISFCLFLACVSSPPLCVLTDAQNIDKEMSYISKTFFLETVKFDYSKKAIYLPALVKTYWADFGNNQSEVLRYIAQTAGSQFAAKIKDYLNVIGKSSAKTHFTPFEWTPVFILTDI